MLGLLFVGFVVILVIVLNLRNRVQKLEQIARSGISEHRPETSYKQSQSAEARQPERPEPLLNYIKEQLKNGISKQEIEQALVTSGWQAVDIEKAFSLAISSTQPIENQADLEPIGPETSEKFIKWLKEDWLLKLGAMLLLIGFGWLTTYAFLNNWIGPMGRIALGIITGVLFIVFGWYRINKYITQGGIFMVLGSTTVLLTIFAARSVYDFFTPLTALIVMFLSTAFVALASVKYNSRALALLSLGLAGIAPLLTKSPATDHVWLFAYLFIVILGAIWIVALTGQRILTAAGLIIISIYSLPHFSSPFSYPLVNIDTLLLFAYAFAAVFFLTNTVGLLKLKDKEIVPDLITAAGNGLFLLTWIMNVAQDEWKSLIISAWMIVFTVGAFLIFKITNRREPFYVYAGIGIAMLAAATSAELSGATLVIAYTIESGLIALITYLVLRDIKVAQSVSLLLVGPILMSASSINSPAWATSVFNKDFFVLLILGLTLFGLGLFFWLNVRQSQDKASRQFSFAWLITGSIYAYTILWLCLHAGLENESIATMISLVVYTIVGLLSYFFGLANRRNGLKIYGGILVGFVVVRLFLVDIWLMELAGRIVTFFLIGALLMSTAFLGKKNKV